MTFALLVFIHRMEVKLNTASLYLKLLFFPWKHSNLNHIERGRESLKKTNKQTNKILKISRFNLTTEKEIPCPYFIFERKHSNLNHIKRGGEQGWHSGDSAYLLLWFRFNSQTWHHMWVEFSFPHKTNTTNSN